MQQYIYIMISRTPTMFGSVIRKFAKQQYNHASVAIDENLEHTYAFARFKHSTPLLGGLVRENLDRFTLRRDSKVPVIVYKIPVTDEQYTFVTTRIEEMMNKRKKFIYNLLSIVTYPFLHGCSMRNAFTCIEFAAYVLKYLGFLQDKPACKYKPDDLLVELSDYKYKECDIRECITYNPQHTKYFEKATKWEIAKSIQRVFRLIGRTFRGKGARSCNINYFQCNMR